ncbi:MAG TPA: hypothetical protein VE912_17390 [Bacteroidales bacterium]|nr:hypothetical protein [Bacteroidales bacterium]
MRRRKGVTVIPGALPLALVSQPFRLVAFSSSITLGKKNRKGARRKK